MEAFPKSIAEHIQCLARMTGASDNFVTQVKDLFSHKGIPLESDATPYLSALDEAFTREENIRANAVAARTTISKVQNRFNQISRNYERQLARLKQARADLRKKNHGLRPKLQSAGKNLEVSLPGADHRTLVTRQENDQLPLVPGPEEKQ